MKVVIDMSDSELKLNHFYWAMIIDPELGDLRGKEIKVKFTGIAFRNCEYNRTEIPDYINDDREAVRKRLTDQKLVDKKDAVLMLSQIKIFREVSHND